LISNAKNGLFLVILLTAAPCLFAQNESRQVALVPFWGNSGGETHIVGFGEEVFAGILELGGYQPVMIDMNNLPSDVPEGGFPPNVSPGPSLTRGMPFAVTGEISPDAATPGSWDLRLYLWRMTDNRLMYSDRVTAPDREFLNIILGGMLEFLFSWLVEEQPMYVTAGRDAIFILGGENALVSMAGGGGMGTAPLPNHLLHLGIRAGGVIQWLNPLWSAEGVKYADWESISGAVHINFEPFRLIERFPADILYALHSFGIQVEGVAMYDFRHSAFTMLIPMMGRATIRTGTSYFAVMGGVYLFTLLGGSSPNPDRDIQFGAEGEKNLYGITAGISMGSRLGPGALFMELRWFNDMFAVIRTDNFNRHFASVSIGYEFSFFRK